jgi:predicted lipid-binding transport protein (Tim44 family)
MHKQSFLVIAVTLCFCVAQKGSEIAAAAANSTNTNSSSGRLNGGAIAGILVGVLITVCSICVCCVAIVTLSIRTYLSSRNNTQKNVRKDDFSQQPTTTASVTIMPRDRFDSGFSNALGSKSNTDSNA